MAIFLTRNVVRRGGPAPTTRRSLFRGGAALAAIGAVAVAPLIAAGAGTRAPVTTAHIQREELTDHPALALCQRYREAEAAQVPIAFSMRDTDR